MMVKFGVPVLLCLAVQTLITVILTKDPMKKNNEAIISYIVCTFRIIERKTEPGIPSHFALSIMQLRKSLSQSHTH